MRRGECPLKLVPNHDAPARRRFRVYTRKHLDTIPQLARLPRERRDLMKATSAVLPFRVNNYVIEDLIDWSNIPDDPIFQLTFPQPEMLLPEQLERMHKLVRAGAPAEVIVAAARKIQLKMNPHPAGQMDMNIPTLGHERIEGMQHKYRETVLFFPARGQTCHAYCTYCFRWAQFVGMDELKFANRQVAALVAYLKAHHEVSSVLFTGGDPMVMKASVLRRYVEPLLAPGLEHIESIRIGTKAPAYWPYRFVTDDDADDLLRLFEEVRAARKHLALMAHFSHPRELANGIVARAMRRIQNAGAVIRTQAPLIRNVNDSSEVWSDLWKAQVRLGAVPYYMFVERNTGPKRYFEVPLARALGVFAEAHAKQSGIGRTVRGPSMSANPGKVLVDGIVEVAGEKVFVLKFLQGRDPRWAGQTFFARFDPQATWLDELKPAFGESQFFFEDRFEEIKARQSRAAGC